MDNQRLILIVEDDEATRAFLAENIAADGKGSRSSASTQFPVLIASALSENENTQSRSCTASSKANRAYDDRGGTRAEVGL